MSDPNELQKLQREWFQFGEGDLVGAKILSNAKGSSNTIGLLLQQAIEKYLKGYLLGHGWELVKTHNIEFLLAEAARFNENFTAFYDFGRAVTALYAEDRYPIRHQEEVSNELLKQMIEVGERLIGLVLKSTE